MARRIAHGRKPKARPMRPRREPIDCAGWNTLPFRTRRYCPICWACLDHLVHVDWCPQCRKTLRLGL
jgi:hypothetical protein